MSRYASYAAAETVPESRDVDRVFVGVRELNPGEIPPGFVARARNCRFSNGEAAPRLGVAKLPWTNRVTLQSQHTQPFGTVYGASEFQEALGVDWLIIAADGKVYRCRQFTAAAEVPLPPGTIIDHEVSFTQTRNGLVMWRGDKLPLIMPDLETGFTTMVKQANVIEGVGEENPTAGPDDIPAAARGDWIGNRLFFPYATATELDLVGISDYSNATRHNPLRGQTRINQGGSDRLLRVVRFSDNVAVCFKEASIYILQNVFKDLSQMLLTELTPEYGLCSPKAVANTGKDLWFLAPKRGICSVRLTEQNKIQGLDLPQSATLQETTERINWKVAAKKATAAYFSNKFYLAVPLDDATHAGVNQVSGVYSGGTRTVIVRAGKTYRYVKGANDTSLTNGLQVLTESQDFIATSTSVTLTGAAGKTITAEFREVLVDVNNAVIVYDFVAGEWAGVDDGSAFCVSDFVTATYNGVERLMFVGEDGFVNCVEELFYDETAYWSLGDFNLLDITPGAEFVDVAVEPGQCYRFAPGDEWSTLQNGPHVYSETTDFTAQSSTVRVVQLFGEVTPIDAVMQPHIYLPVIEYVDCDWTSRGYGGDSMSRKKWSDMEVHAKTWFPEFQITAKSEGVKQEIPVSPDSGWRTKSRSAYDDPWDAKPYNLSNSSDDHQRKGRQDYSVILGESYVLTGQIKPGIKYMVQSADVTSDCMVVYNGTGYSNNQTFVGVAGVTSFGVTIGQPIVYPPGSYLEFGQNGMLIDEHQEWFEELRIPPVCRGRLVQLRFRCRQGRMIVKGVGPQGSFTSRAKGVRT